ncbi:MAG: methyltransferase domain-containing protein [Candidatus Krumholzibacteriota bacterium]|nr:methyltransferase domain-containing protein [Candidatus Krumholzibacteriota bacterium]
MSRYKNKFTMDAVREFWDGVAEHEYEHCNEEIDRVHTQRFREALKRLRLGPGMRMLNVWSRIGDGIPWIRQGCSDIILINAELSLEMLKVSKKLSPEEIHVQTSLHELPFGDDSFDTVLSLETLEHVPDPLLFLREIRRILVPGGRLVMSLPPSYAEWTSWLNAIHKFHHGEGPHRFIAPRVVKKMMQEAGLRLDDYQGTLFIPLEGELIEKIDVWLSDLIGRSFLGQLCMRSFYVCTASL